MNSLTTMLLLTTAAGLAMPAGALAAGVDRGGRRELWNELRHSIIAFGGGALLSAVSLVLVPRAIEALSWPWAGGLLLLGGLTFMGLDRALAAIGGSAAQLVAMLADFIPEALALGATFASGEHAGIVLALMIALQNLPEGFNACRELRGSTPLRQHTIVWSFLAMALLGPAAGLAGYLLLANAPAVVGGVMIWAAGGILYLTFEDIAPQAKEPHRYGPPIGAVCGFLLGLLGHMLIEG